MKQTTIIFPVHNNHVLLGMKKRWFGEGKWNGFGGKLEWSETFIQNAVRELQEESGIDVQIDNIDHKAIVEFMVQEDTSQEFVLFNLCHVFTVICDTLWQETDEMRPQSFPIDKLPLDDMFEWDRVWVSQILTKWSTDILKIRVLYTSDFTFVWYEELT